MITIQQINDIREFQPLHAAWSSLLRQTPDADFFRTAEWLETYWTHHGDGQYLRVIVIEEDDEVTGILPLVIRPYQTRIGTFRVLTYPLDHWGSFYGPIGADPAGTLRAGLAYIAGQERDWDFINLQWMDGASTDDLTGVELPVTRRPCYDVPVVDLTVPWQDYWSSRSTNWRSNCRRNEKKLAKIGPVEHFRYRPQGEEKGDADPRWDLFDECEGIARRSWQGESTDGTTISHDSVSDFLRNMHLTAVRTGCLDLNLLRVNGETVAFNYNYCYRGYVSSLRLGFDHSFAKHGAGTVLTYRMLMDSSERGDRTFDFLPGSLDVKARWQTEARAAVSYEHLPAGPPRVELLRAKHWLSDNIQRFREHVSSAS